MIRSLSPSLKWVEGKKEEAMLGQTLRWIQFGQCLNYDTKIQQPFSLSWEYHQIWPPCQSWSKMHQSRHPLSEHLSEYYFTSLSAQSWQYRDRRKPEGGTMPYSYFEWLQGFFIMHSTIGSTVHSMPLNSFEHCICTTTMTNIWPDRDSNLLFPDYKPQSIRMSLRNTIEPVMKIAVTMRHLVSGDNIKSQRTSVFQYLW